MSSSDKSDRAVAADAAEPEVSALRASILSAGEKRLKSLAADHYRNARRLAHRLTLAEDELRRLKKELHQ